MSSLNSVALNGRLTKDVELKYTTQGTAVAKGSIAVNVPGKDQAGNWTNEGHFFNFTVWGKIAESLAQYMLKGKLIGLQGELRQNRWTDNQGNNKSTVEIHVRSIELIPTGNKENSNTSTGYKKSNPYNGQTNTVKDDFEDDIPF